MTRLTWVVLFVVTGLVAGAMGVAGTLLWQRVTAPGTSAVDAQGADVAEDLRRDLTAGFYSPGHPYGGQFTEGTVVAQVEAHGGVVLSARTEVGEGGAEVHTDTVMLGLVPPSATGGKTVVADAYPVRCYRYTFGIGAYSVKQSTTSCPASRTDGKPGSPVAEMGALLARQPVGPSAYRELSAAGYSHDRREAMDFLKDKRLVGARDAVTVVSGRAHGGDVYVVALRINGVCHYLRMDSAASASRLIPLWAAPADEQRKCGAAQAATLFGTDPAKAG
ncbi:hypothetical protein [Streptomyces sp. V3I7]|uniref:hypothetical protein n=1 Tax=Streptomyces sp. V3I7 TaxID=3042278 RepID=UPI0027853C96|nr:hypothetical protein [Streptomyces sp. V3I7]MDQ0994043.1 hypothetical protein [Streptomyces sp. V3I7]